MDMHLVTCGHHLVTCAPLGDMCATLIDLRVPLRNIIDPFPLLRHHYVKRAKVRIN